MAGKKKAGETPSMGDVGADGPKTVGVAPTVPTGTYEWAVNPLKLNRAVAFVQSQTPRPAGAAFNDAVKERYLALNGLLAEKKPTGRKGKGKGAVQNMADDDGSDD